MSLPENEQFITLVALIKEVKPGLANVTINAADSLIETLGLDSLDVLQLSRKVNRKIGMFDLDTWMTNRGSVQSILDQVKENLSTAVGQN